MRSEGESGERNIKWKGKTILKNKKNEGVQKSSHTVQFKKKTLCGLLN